MSLHEPEVFSLWLMPEGEAFNRLAKQIRALARRYKTPVFEPHVTLLGSVCGSRGEICGNVRTLTRQLRPLSIRLQHIESHDQYFRCLFLNVEKSREILEARRKAGALFNRDDPYQPHLSLMYGEIGERAKRALACEIGASFMGMRFLVRRISLYETRADVDSWRAAGDFFLKDLISSDP